MTEIELFNTLKDGYYPDLVMMNNQFSNFDCVSEDMGLYIELKCRNTHYDELLIEKYKYDRIVEQANMVGKIPVYVCSTPEGIWEFNLEYIKPNWEVRGNMPTTTEFDNKERIAKVVGYLPTFLGLKIKPRTIASDQEVDELLKEFDSLENWSDPMENEDMWDESNWIK